MPGHFKSGKACMQKMHNGWTINGYSFEHDDFFVASIFLQNYVDKNSGIVTYHHGDDDTGIQILSFPPSEHCRIHPVSMLKELMQNPPTFYMVGTIEEAVEREEEAPREERVAREEEAPKEGDVTPADPA